MTTSITSGLRITDEFQRALDLLAGGSHLFLTGKAGTGKSTLIRLFTGSTTKNIVVAAPTGVAALNVDGYTLHRLFSFPAGVTPDHVRSDRYYPYRFADTLQSLETLIIDEASMVRADLLDSIAAALSRFGPQPGTAFGGVQIVLVGDLYQLPPVVTDTEREYFSTAYSSPYFFAAQAYAREAFPMVELTTVFRQNGDPEFLSILNVIRDGQATPQAVEKLNAHVDADFETPDDEFWLTLTTKNSTADKLNREKLATLHTETFSSQASMTGELDGFEKPTQDVLDFKIGAQIMLLTNDAQDRWVNGTLGVITGVQHEDDDYAVEVELRDHRRVTVRSHTWEITRPGVSDGALTHEVIGTFRQLPFRLAWAVTIHKAQGLTLQRCVIDLTGGAFADGQLYVALSRATSLDGLVLTRPVRPRDLRVNQDIRRFQHTSTGGQRAQYAVVAANVVGDEGFNWRPRPIELAVILPDGTELTTLVDPQRDLGNAADTFDISAEDVVLAPTLPLAWAALAPQLAGRIPVGFNVTDTLGLIDFELKRHDQIIHIPIGVEAKSLATRRVLRQLDQPLAALEQARIVQDLLDSTPENELPAATAFDEADTQFGYLLAPDSQTERRFILHPSDTETLANYLGTLSQEAKNSPQLMATLRAVEAQTGHEVLAPDMHTERTAIADVLVPGATVCFTGEARDPKTKEPIERSELEKLAATRELTSESNLTKSRTTALIVAEFGTQSGKAKRARQWEKPIFSVEEFLHWIHGTQAADDQPSAPDVNVSFEELPAPAATTVPDHAPGEPVEAHAPETFEEVAQAVPKAGDPEASEDEAPAAVESDDEVQIPWSTESLSDFFVPGAVVSATGSLYDPEEARRVTQDELAHILGQHNLRYERNVTQQRTTVLLVGETPKITRQIDAAIDYHKPIFPAAGFFSWLGEQQSARPPTDVDEPEVPEVPEPVEQEEPVVPTPPPPASVTAPPEASPQQPQPQDSASAQPDAVAEADLPWWVSMSTGKFYGLAVGVPLGLFFVLPILLFIVAAIIPATEPAMTGLAAGSILVSWLAALAAVVFIGLRIGGRRKLHKPGTHS